MKRFALLAALAVPCLAQASVAFATFSDIHYTLTDLDPNDGITPAIEAQTTFEKQLTYTSFDGATQVPGFLTPGHAVGADASVTANSLSVLATATPSRQFDGAAPNSWWAMHLTPNTLMTFTGTATVFASATGACKGTHCDEASAHVTFSWSSPPSDGEWRPGPRQDLALTFDRANGGGTQTLTKDFTFALASRAVGSTIWWVAEAGANVAAVPEPETYALMLAGLVGVGVAARRTRAGRRGAVFAA